MHALPPSTIGILSNSATTPGIAGSLDLDNLTLSNLSHMTTIEQRIKAAINNRWRTVHDSCRHHRRATKIARAFPGMTPATFDQEQVVKFLQSHGTLQPSTLNKYMSVLSGLGFKVRFYREDPPEARILTEAEIAQLDTNVKESTHPPIFKAVYAILRDSGCRGLTELRRLKPEDIDWNRKTFKLTSLKGRKERKGEIKRTIPMNDVTERALAWWVNSGEYWPTDGKWWSYWLKVRVDQYNKPYDLRHTFCTRLLSKDVPPVTVQKIMGHARMEQTMHYYHWTSEALDGARQALQYK